MYIKTASGFSISDCFCIQFSMCVCVLCMLCADHFNYFVTTLSSSSFWLSFFPPPQRINLTIWHFIHKRNMLTEHIHSVNLLLLSVVTAKLMIKSVHCVLYVLTSINSLNNLFCFSLLQNVIAMTNFISKFRLLLFPRNIVKNIHTHTLTKCMRNHFYSFYPFHTHFFRTK